MHNFIPQKRKQTKPNPNQNTPRPLVWCKKRVQIGIGFSQKGGVNVGLCGSDLAGCQEGKLARPGIMHFSDSFPFFLFFLFLFLLGDAGTQSLFKYVRIFRVCSIRACIRGYNCNYMEATFKEGVHPIHIPSRTYRYRMELGGDQWCRSRAYTQFIENVT